MINLTKREISLLDKLESAKGTSISNILIEMGCDPETFFDSKSQYPALETPYSIGERVSYFPHGTGVISNIEISKLAGFEMPFYVVSFAKSKTIKIPLDKVGTSKLRRLTPYFNHSKIEKILSSKPSSLPDMNFYYTNPDVMTYSEIRKEQAAIRKRLNSAITEEVADALVILHFVKKNRRMFTTEHELYDAAYDFLADEMSASLMIEKYEARDRIGGFLSSS